ncbi:MAG: hypothetical protein EPN76_11690 [Burkholderiaceae bacterium]|nr:MAG: hypothetical protein EPN76_11690 [Burkholderiaceae bacterium]TAM08161.1 MAG: hypothetical protein EPN67_02900 [Pusillimonas sp.]
MSAVQVLVELRRAGVTLEVLEGNRLAAPAGFLTDEHREAIRDHKQELLALLRSLPVPRHAQAPGDGPSWRRLKIDFDPL